MTLTEFLLARIAEDEADAWRWLEDFGTVYADHSDYNQWRP